MFEEEELEKIEKERIKWEKEVLAKYLKRGERKEQFKTSSNIHLKQVYEPNDIGNLDYLNDLNLPGSDPFTRGVYPTMYRGRIWTMRQYSGFADAKKTNERFKYLISQGQKGLSIAFDLPTQMGYNSDYVLSRGEVGRVGVSINSLKDFEILFEDIPLDQVSTSMTINSPTAIILAMYIALAEKRGIDPAKLRGTVQNDILKEYIARGTYIFPPKPSLRLTADVIEYCSEKLPKFNTISISGYHMREAGSNAIQELAFTLANGITYVKEVLKRGINIDDFAPRLSFFFTAQNNIFEEIAKFRAARRLWAKIMKEKFNAQDKKSLMLRFHTQTAGITLTAQQPYVNLIRVAYQALSAVLGGTQSLHTCGFDEALSIPTKDSVRLSLRTQQILAYETGVTDVVDPFGGSYLIEFLTSKLEEEAMIYINKIEKMGGMPNAIDQNYIQEEILNNAYAHQRKIENSQEKVVGVNTFKIKEDFKIPTFKFDESIETAKIKQLKKLRSNRNNDKVKKNLDELKEIAQSNQNLIPKIIDTVKSYATIQEICDVLRSVFGEYEERQVF
ncbi:MAG: methylmalonyl-CoA mutase [Candidatus Lokiarchaeota archaeon]|nr:methylmalonyl-CoA mutase [Candidatus Lokiarchaeota archaeon]MBD3200570.1 methylmalonyl-CoA mutase [Candidatus Lokiarchaeota archaeon]